MIQVTFINMQEGHNDAAFFTYSLASICLDYHWRYQLCLGYHRYFLAHIANGSLLYAHRILLSQGLYQITCKIHAVIIVQKAYGRFYGAQVLDDEEKADDYYYCFLDDGCNSLYGTACTPCTHNHRLCMDFSHYLSFIFYQNKKIMPDSISSLRTAGNFYFTASVILPCRFFRFISFFLAMFSFSVSITASSITVPSALTAVT